jgi:hypothetical protein
MAVSKRLRFEVLRRDSHTCRYCGAKAPDATLRIDHVVPVTLGGSDAPENLVTSCFDCNAGKSSIPADAAIVADVAADALRWAKAIEQVGDSMMDELMRVDSAQELIDDAWSDWGTGSGENRRQIPRPDTWRTSVTQILATGLPIDVMIVAVGTAMASRAPNQDKWRYWCGICWRKAEELRDRAAEIVGAES